ncbi:hypothetical protein G418_17585 [Rhodococcus qingshengii BKS 20-40]|nr:hypothetical protein G418_17585 [Rhodococcus qingshengii BKS 20-40]
MGPYPELFGACSAADVVHCANTLLSDDGDGVTGGHAGAGLRSEPLPRIPVVQLFYDVGAAKEFEGGKFCSGDAQAGNLDITGEVARMRPA